MTMTATALKVFVRSFGRRVEYGTLTLIYPNGDEEIFSGPKPGPSAVLRIVRPRAARRILTGGDIGFAEAYMDGDVEIPDLATFLVVAGENERVWTAALEGSASYRLVQRVIHRMRRNSRPGARRNIRRHYDLGNAFYQRWLDPTMAYSSAVYPSPDTPLDAAQVEKYRRIAKVAALEAGEDVLEIGCGWGGFARFAAAEFGCRVTGITISKAQHAFATQAVRDAGLTDRVRIELADYRDIEGRFDKIVSIEMFEAVGERYWPDFFVRIRDGLRAGGRAALQVITIDDATFNAYRRGTDFIQRYIFPGGMLPSHGALVAAAERAGLRPIETTAYGAHYARTLEIWRERFDRAWSEIASEGFDERFRRMWRYYLAYCEAGFRIGRVDVEQIGIVRP